MFGLYHLLKHHISFIGISVAGAMASNIAQLLLAGLLMFGPSIRLIVPPFLIMGLASSIVLGLFVQRFSEHSRWYTDHELHDLELEEHTLKASDTHAKADSRLITGLIILPAFLLQPSTAATAALALLALGAAAIVGRRIRILPNLLVLVSVTLANLLQANGLVLFEVWGFAVTAGALSIGLKKALTLIGLIYLSQYMVSRRPRLPGLFGYVVSLQLYYFEQITQKWRSQEKGGLIHRLDQMLYRLEHEEAVELQPERSLQAGAPAARVLFVLASWALLIPGYLELIP
jgi:heptaprenyl diphosphate synthase